MTKSQRIRLHAAWPEYLATRKVGKGSAAAKHIAQDLAEHGVTLRDIWSASQYARNPGRPRTLKRCPTCDQPTEGSRASRHTSAHSA